jgi:hypothetical protein
MTSTGTRWRGRRIRPAAWAAGVALVAVTGAVWGAHAWAARDTTPSCSWPMRTRGTATADQAGLVRCYLRALAHRDIAGLYAVADYIPKVRITAADLRYSADARSGLATVDFAPSSVSYSWLALTITYADGAVESTGMQNMWIMGGPSTWRMVIGGNS